MALVSVEALDQRSARAVGTVRYNLFAPPTGTRFLRLPLVQGRWPEPGEVGAVVINRHLLDRERLLRVGSTVGLRVGDRLTPVSVVGVVEEVGEPALYTDDATVEAVTGTKGHAADLRIVVEGDQRRTAAALEEALVGSGRFPTVVMTRDSLRRSLVDHFLIVLGVLGGAAVASVVVGGLGMATSMTLNVLERSREIGVLRAIGAGRGTIVRVLALEGGTVAGLSVVAAVALSLPISGVVGWLVGTGGLHASLPFVVSGGAILGWVGLTVVVAAAACLWPARNALRLPVREVLAYE